MAELNDNANIYGENFHLTLKENNTNKNINLHDTTQPISLLFKKIH